MEEILNKLTKHVNELTPEEFESLPSRDWREDIGEFDSVIIIPGTEVHSTGYRCMDFVASYQGMAICKIGGGHDVVHIEGVGGWGGHAGMMRFFPNRSLSHLPEGWQFDCLNGSGYLRLFIIDGRPLTVEDMGPALDVYSVPLPPLGGTDQSSTKE